MKNILHILLILFFCLTIISCSKKDDDSSSSSSATTLSPPSDLTAAGAASQVTLDWTAVSGASSYTVYWDNSTGVSSSSTAITSVSTDNYTHSSLDNGTTYYYKVATVDSAGTGTLSSEVNAATPLPAPDNLSASGANNTITLIWNSVSGATSYTLYWDNVSGIDSSDTAITSITNDNYTHNNMDNGSTYYYKVAAVNSSGTGTLSSVASALLSADIQGSQTYNAHTYAITSSAMNHADATAAAASAGGYLVTITTKAENDWLTATFETIYGDIWIGAKDVIVREHGCGIMAQAKTSQVVRYGPLITPHANFVLMNLIIPVIVHKSIKHLAAGMIQHVTPQNWASLNLINKGF